MASLSNILREAGVQDTFIDKLSDDGWTIELFSMAAPTMDKFDDELKEILGDLFDITTAVQRSALRLAWSRCQASQSPPSTVEASPVPSLSDGATAQSSWSETFPPKLTSQVVNGMKQKFKRNYPSRSSFTRDHTKLAPFEVWCTIRRRNPNFAWFHANTD